MLERKHEARPERVVLRGDEEELYRHHHEQLLRSVQVRLRVSRAVAEDACSQAWLQFLRYQPERDSAIGWLYTVAKHEAFAAIRSERRESPTDELPPMASGDDIERAYQAVEALRALRGLKPQQRVVLYMQAEGFSYKEIVRHSGRTYTWVNRHLTEGRQAARRLEAER